MTENRVIARDGRMPWHLPADLRFFQRTTLGHHVIMGRKTFEAMDGPLPGRTNVVITRQRDWTASGASIAHSLDEALAMAEGDDEPFIAGGAEIYALAMPRATRLYLTVIHTTMSGDTFFPEFDESPWRETWSERKEPDERHRWPMTFRRYDRVK